MIGGKDVALAETFDQVMPHDKDHVLAKVSKGDASHVQQAIDAAADRVARLVAHAVGGARGRAACARPSCSPARGARRSTPRRCSASRRPRTRRRSTPPASSIDFWRFNVSYMTRIYEEQPISSPGVWNRLEYRPLEGFVFAVTPFNFTAIGGNLPTSAALMGNTVVWKPASTAAYSAHFLMQLLQEAGLPDGVINLVYGSGAEIGDAALASQHLAGVHFTGSTGVFQSMWKTIGANIAELPQLPAHRRRDRRQGLHRRARVRGRRRHRDGDRPRRVRVPGTEVLGRVAAVHRPTTSGRSCASGSRPRSTRCRSATCATSGTSWARSSTATRSRRRRRRSTRRSRRRRSSPAARTTTREGWFVRPTVVETDDPDFRLMKEELFGPVVTAFVYPHKQYDETLDLIDNGSPYGLTGAVFARDRGAIEHGRGQAPLHGRQLLRQRQADRRGRRPAAVRRRARVGHERQGGLDVEPDPLGQPADGQGDVRAADATTAIRSWIRTRPADGLDRSRRAAYPR